MISLPLLLFFSFFFGGEPPKMVVWPQPNRGCLENKASPNLRVDVVVEIRFVAQNKTLCSGDCFVLAWALPMFDQGWQDPRVMRSESR